MPESPDYRDSTPDRPALAGMIQDCGSAFRRSSGSRSDREALLTRAPRDYAEPAQLAAALAHRAVRSAADQHHLARGSSNVATFDCR
jgi:hypothetical protein